MNDYVLPHQRLIVYGKAIALLEAVRDARVRDAKLRDEAMRAAKGTALNIAEGAARVTRADKARAYAIARGEACEAAAGDATIEAAERVAGLANEVYAMLTRGCNEFCAPHSSVTKEHQSS